MSTTTQPDDIVAIERTAELGAVVLHFGDSKTAEVLERLDEDPARYHQSRDHWVAAMAREVSRNRESLARDFGAAFARKRGELERDEPSIESLGPLRSVAASEAVLVAVVDPIIAEPTPVQAPASDAPPSPRAPLGIPSYMQQQREVAVVAPAPPPRRPAPVAPVVGSTEPLDLERLRNMLFRGPTPFSGTATPARLGELREEAELRAETTSQPAPAPGSDETSMYVPSAEELKQIATLPFAPANPAPSVDAPAGRGGPIVGYPPLAAPPAAAPPVASFTAAPALTEPAPVPKRVPLAQRGTTPVDLERMRAIMSAGPTPFSGKTSPERLEKLRAEPAVTKARAPGGSLSKATMMATGAPSTPGKALPFAKDDGGASFPDLTVDRYAALAAELQAKGPTPSVLARYEIAAPAALQALHAEHERRFAARPNLRAYFEERKAHFLAFMAPTR